MSGHRHKSTQVLQGLRAMATEIERKFLLKNDTWRDQVEQTVYFCQGYLLGSAQASVRVRIEGDRARLNIKSATLGIRRHEYEYDIPMDEAKEMLDTLCTRPLIEKKRHFIHMGTQHWEIDEFMGENLGLIVAEIELADENESFTRPPWLGREVSDDIRYYNTELVKHPYRCWK